VPKHPPAPQLRSSGDPRRGARRGAPVRAQGQRLDQAVQGNEEAFERAVAAVTEATLRLLDELVTSAPPKDREVEAAKARARSAERYQMSVTS
jgi:hypothetical protein